MGILSIASVAVLVAAIAFGGFHKYSEYTCKNFHIDYSTTPGKVIVITGANSGLGYHTAVALAKANAQVVMACRSERRCEDAKANILNSVPQATITTLPLDLSSFESIRRFVELFRGKFDHVDVLINNAGIMALPQREDTVDGLEAQIGTNHFGHYYLTALLYPYLEKNGRIINHSSSAHMFATPGFVFDDLQSSKSYDPWVAYGNSKIANLYFTYELNRRLNKLENPRNIKVIAVHPGYTATNLQASRFPMWEYANSIFAMKGEDGALAQIYGKSITP
jgi:NAD(P)-dependent dehydrogenase (short-subunit alcohol dehydrogenase family)